MAILTLTANLATRPAGGTDCVSFRFGHQVAAVALIPNFGH